MTKRPANSLTTLMGAGIVAAVVASASMWVSSTLVIAEGAAQSVYPSQVQLACLPGITDSSETTNVATGITWSSLAMAPVSPVSASVAGQGGIIPTAPTLAGQGGGELAGLSAAGCAAVRTPQWIATGVTTAGADMVLILSNPDPAALVVSVDGYDASGPLNVAPCQVTVPARSLASMPLAGWFPDESALTVRVTVDGEGVAIWT